MLFPDWEERDLRDVGAGNDGLDETNSAGLTVINLWIAEDLVKRPDCMLKAVVAHGCLGARKVDIRDGLQLHLHAVHLPVPVAVTVPFDPPMPG